MGLHFIQDFYSKYQINTATQAIISIAIILIMAFLATRLTKLMKLPNVTAYILSGVIIGPYVLNLVPGQIINDMSFVTDIGLGFIAFASGRYFNLSVIKKNGMKPVVMALIQAVLTSAVVLLVMLAFKFSFPVALIIGSIAGSTSAASTLMTIREYHAEGEFVDYAVELDAIDDIFGIFSFSICLGIGLGMLNSGGGKINIFETIWLPILANLGMMAIGAILAFIMGKVINKPTRTHDNRLILTVFCIFLLVGLCGLTKMFSAQLTVTPLLPVLIFAMVYINLTKDEEIFDQVADFSAPIILIFFVLSGMKFQISYLGTVGLVGVVYFLVRLVMKYCSNYFAGVVTKAPKVVTRWVGLTMEPQAGISLGLAAVVLLNFTALDNGENGLKEIGAEINAIIVFAGILYEIAGPLLAKLALKKSGCLDESKRLSKASDAKTTVVRTGSMLHDAVVIKTTPDLSEQYKKLSKIQDEVTKANRYIHTASYTNEYENDDVLPNQEETTFFHKQAKK